MKSGAKNQNKELKSNSRKTETDPQDPNYHLLNKNKFNDLDEFLSQIGSRDGATQSMFLDQGELSGLGLVSLKETVLVKLKKARNQISDLKKERDNIKEEIQFRLMNFAYIIELATKNIVEGLSTKMNSTINEKNKLIRKQNQKIEQLSKITKTKSKSEEENANLKQELEKMKKINMHLVQENRELTSTNLQLKIASEKEKSKQPASTVDEQGQITSLKDISRKESQFKVKKTKTTEGCYSWSHLPDENIKSLDKLKQTMSLFKSELIDGVKKE